MALKELNTVALLRDDKENHLRKGSIGTIVHQYGTDAFEVEFSDLNGQVYASLTLDGKDLLLLCHEPEMV